MSQYHHSTDFGWVNVNTAGAMQLDCGLDDVTGSWHDSITAINVNVWDCATGTDRQINAFGCVRNTTTTAVFCGSADGTIDSFVGEDVLTPSTSTVTNGSYTQYFAYIAVNIGASNTSGGTSEGCYGWGSPTVYPLGVAGYSLTGS